MKKIFKYISMAALAMMGTIFMGCAENDLAEIHPQPQGKGVTLTTTISLNGSSTRALDANGKKTFAEGDLIAIFYKNTSGETQLAESDALKAVDITNDGKTAKITVTFENPQPEGQLRYIYPAAMAMSDFATIDAIDLRLRPREGIAQPSRQSSVVLASCQFKTIAFALSWQNQTLNLNLRTERFAIAIVEHVVDGAIVTLDREVVHLRGRHGEESQTYLIGHLGLYDVTAHRVAVEWGRGALVAQGVDILRVTRVASLDRG